MREQDLKDRLEKAMAITRQAGEMAKGFFESRNELAIEHKGHQDFVSHADRAVETLIRDGLMEEFPDDAIVGEEHGGTAADVCWIIDPIDGTSNFLRGLPYWCVTIAFVVRGDTEIGVTFDPLHDQLFHARRGQGAFRDGERMQVTNRQDIKTGCIGLAFTFKQEPERFISTVSSLLHAGVEQRRLGSSALLLAHVADGCLDGMVANQVNSWDVLAGLLLVQEAGGLASRYQDGAGLLEPRGVMACSPAFLATVEEASGMRM